MWIRGDLKLNQFLTKKKRKRWLLSSAVILGMVAGIGGFTTTENQPFTSQIVHADDWSGDTSTADDTIAKQLQDEISGTDSSETSTTASGALTAYNGGFTLYGDVDNPSLLASYFFTVAQNAEGAIDTNEISLNEMIKYSDASLASDKTEENSSGGATYGNLGLPKEGMESQQAYNLANDIKALYQLDFVASKKPDNVVVGAMKWIADKVVKGAFNAVTGALSMGQFGSSLYDFSNSIISAIGTAIDNLNPVAWFDTTQKSLTNGKGVINVFIETLSTSLGISSETLWGFGRLVIIFVFGAGLIQMMWSLRKSDFRNFLRNNKSFLWRIITIFGLMPTAMGISNTVDTWFEAMTASYNSVSYFSDKFTVDTTKFATTLNLNMSLLREGTSSSIMTNDEIKKNYPITESKIQSLNNEINKRWNTLQGNSSDEASKTTSGTKASVLFNELLNPTYVNIDAYTSSLRESDSKADISASKITTQSVTNTSTDLGSIGFTTGGIEGGINLPSTMSPKNFFFVDNTSLQTTIQKVKANLAYYGIGELDEEAVSNLISGNTLYNQVANKNYAYVSELLSGSEVDEEKVTKLGGEISEALTKLIDKTDNVKIFSSNSSSMGSMKYSSSDNGNRYIAIYSSNMTALSPKRVYWNAPETYLYGVNKKYGYSNANNYTFANLSNSDFAINYISGDLLNFDLTQKTSDEMQAVVDTTNSQIIANQETDDEEARKEARSNAEAKFTYFMMGNARDIALRNKYQGISSLQTSDSNLTSGGYSFSNQGVVILLQSYLKDNTLIFNGVQTVPDSNSSKKQTARDGVTFQSLTIPNVGITDLANRMYYFSATWLTVGVVSLIVLITFFKLPFFTAIGKVFTHFFKGQFRGDFASGMVFLVYFTVLKTSRFFAYLSINIATLASSTLITWVRELINILGSVDTGNPIGNASLWVGKTVLSGMANNTFMMAILILIIMAYPVMTTQFGKKTVKAPLASIILVMPYIMATAFEESMYSLRAKMYGSKAGTSFLDRVRQRTQMKSVGDVAGEIGEGIVNTAKVGAGLALSATGVGAGLGMSMAADGAGGLLGGADGNALAQGAGVDGIIDNTNSGGFGDMIQTFAKPKQIGSGDNELEGIDPDNEEIMLREMAEQELREEEKLREMDELQDEVVQGGGSHLIGDNPVILNEDGSIYKDPRDDTSSDKVLEGSGYVKPVELEVSDDLEDGTIELEADRDKLNTAMAGAMGLAGVRLAKKLSETEFKRDENGEVVLDENGNPIPVEVDDKNSSYQRPTFGNVDVEADTATIEGQNLSTSGLERPVSTESEGSEQKPQYVRPDEVIVDGAKVKTDTVESDSLKAKTTTSDKEEKTSQPLTREQMRARDKENLGKLGTMFANAQDAKYTSKVEAKAQREQAKMSDPKYQTKQAYDDFKQKVRVEYETVMKDPNATKEQKRDVTQRYMQAQRKGSELAKEQGVHWTSPVKETKERVVNTTKETFVKAQEDASKTVKATFDPSTYSRMAESVAKGFDNTKEKAKETVVNVAQDVKSGYAKDKIIADTQVTTHKVIEKTKEVTNNVTNKVTEKTTEKLAEVRQDLTDPVKLAERKQQSKDFWKQMVGVDSDKRSKSGSNGSNSDRANNPINDRINDRLNIRDEVRQERTIEAMERLADAMERNEKD